MIYLKGLVENSFPIRNVGEIMKMKLNFLYVSSGWIRRGKSYANIA